MKHTLLVAVTLTAAACGGPPELGQHQLDMTMSPITYDFGAVAVGSASAPRSFLVTAAIDEDDYLQSVTSDCPGFTVDTSGLALPFNVYRYCEGNPSAFAPCPGVSARFNVSFTPQFAGLQSCTITATLDLAGALTSTVTGTGVAPALGQAVIAPGDGALDFGDVVVGTSSANLAVIIRNVGTDPLDLGAAELTGPGADAFAVDDSGANPLAPGDDHTWSVRCTPPTSGAYTATLTLPSAAPSSPVTIALSCDGIESNLTIAPAPVWFDETLVGATSSRFVTLTNAGAAELTFGTASLTGAGFSTPALPTGSLLPGASVTLQLDFAPTAAEADLDVIGQLVVPFDSGERTIELVGPARTAAIALTPAGGALDFGAICVGQGRTRELIAVNPGSGAIAIDDVTVTGDGLAITELTPGMLPAPLPARGGGALRVALTATPPVGPITGTLRLLPSTPAVELVDLTVTALGVDAGVAASPAAVDFGGVLVGEASVALPIRVDNCDAEAVIIDRLAVTGDAAVDFLATPEVGTALPVTVPSGSAATFIVVMRPSATGDRAATLELGHGDAVTTVPLTGIGVGEDELGGAGGRGSYYACTTHRGGLGGGLALGLGLAAALSRRRRRRR